MASQVGRYFVVLLMTVLPAVGFLSFSLSAQPSIPANAKAVPYGKGWECVQGYLERGRLCVPFTEATDSEIRQFIIQKSMASYSGNCPCPFSLDRAGRKCGARSAYSKPGGASPTCYESDVSDREVQRVRAAGGVK